MKSRIVILLFSFTLLRLVLLPSCFPSSGETIGSLLSKEINVFDSKKTRLPEQLVELARGYHIPMGIEAIYDPDAKPSPPIHLEKATLEEVLSRIVQQNPGYSWQATEGVVHVFSESVVSDPKNFLNLRIPEFKAERESLLFASGLLKLKIEMYLHPERFTHGYGGGSGYGLDPTSGFDVPNITLDSQYLSIREILNRLILLNGNALWVVNFIPGSMMQEEDFLAQTYYLFPAREAIRGFYWDLIPLGAKKKSQ